MGLRRSFLVGEDIDGLLAENSVTRMTLALMYSTDFFDQLERRILPALRSGLIVLADRYIFTLIARAAVRGIGRDYLHGIYEIALRPDLTFWLNVRPEVAFDREFKKSQTISYWESGRDMSLSNDLFQSFIRYQSMIKREFEYLSKRHGFIELDGEGERLRSKPGAAQTHRVASRNPQHAIQAFTRLVASLALRLAAPVQLAAIDAGSNAIRLAIARATSPQHIEILENERAAVRLGHNAFTHRMLDDETIARAARAFRHFRDRMDQYQRERIPRRGHGRGARSAQLPAPDGAHPAKSRHRTGSDQQRGRSAAGVLGRALGAGRSRAAAADFRSGRRQPGTEFLRARSAASIASALPLGTIRLMETYSIDGAIDEDNAQAPAPSRSVAAARARCRRRRSFRARSALPAEETRKRWCGWRRGRWSGSIPTINVRLLRDQTWRMIGAGRAGTNARFPRAERPRGSDGHRRDYFHHAGEMAGPALDAGARRGRARRAAARSGRGTIFRAQLRSEEEKGRAAELLASARWFARRLDYNPQHAEQVVAAGAFAFRSAAADPRNGRGPAAGAGNWRAAARRGTFRAPQIAPPPRRIPDPQRRNSGTARLAARYGGGAGALSQFASPSRSSSTLPMPRSTASGGARRAC